MESLEFEKETKAFLCSNKRKADFLDDPVLLPLSVEDKCKTSKDAPEGEPKIMAQNSSQSENCNGATDTDSKCRDAPKLYISEEDIQSASKIGLHCPSMHSRCATCVTKALLGFDDNDHVTSQKECLKHVVSNDVSKSDEFVYEPCCKKAKIPTLRSVEIGDKKSELLLIGSKNDSNGKNSSDIDRGIDNVSPLTVFDLMDTEDEEPIEMDFSKFRTLKHGKIKHQETEQENVKSEFIPMKSCVQQQKENTNPIINCQPVSTECLKKGAKLDDKNAKPSSTSNVSDKSRDQMVKMTGPRRVVYAYSQELLDTCDLMQKIPDRVYVKL